MFYGDVKNIDSLKEPIEKSDIIFHVAANYRLWSRKPSEIYESNVLGTENISNLALENNKILIYTSSVATLGLKKDKVSDENCEAKFSEMHGDYKKSKYLAEKIVMNFVKKKN